MNRIPKNMYFNLKKENLSVQNLKSSWFIFTIHQIRLEEFKQTVMNHAILEKQGIIQIVSLTKKANILLMSLKALNAE